MPSIVEALCTIQCLLYYLLLLYTIFPVERKNHSFIEIAKLPGDLEFAVVLLSHLTVEYRNVNMHTS